MKRVMWLEQAWKAVKFLQRLCGNNNNNNNYISVGRRRLRIGGAPTTAGKARDLTTHVGKKNRTEPPPSPSLAIRSFRFPASDLLPLPPPTIPPPSTTPVGRCTRRRRRRYVVFRDCRCKTI